MMKMVCVVGVGVFGLVVMKYCLEEGLELICFEKDDDVGGFWNYYDVFKDGYLSLYNLCSINISKEMMCYSDFLIFKEFFNFMVYKYFKSYLKFYVENFGLLKYIKFKYEVVFIEKVDDFEDSGDWVVMIKNLILGKVEKRKVNCVMVCNGYFYELNIFNFKGFDKFKGRVLYIYDYKDFYGYEGKRVLIIGVGNFVLDVVCELSRYVEYVSLWSLKMLFNIIMYVCRCIFYVLKIRNK